MEKGKKGSAIIERFKHLGDYVKKSWSSGIGRM